MRPRPKFSVNEIVLTIFPDSLDNTGPCKVVAIEWEEPQLATQTDGVECRIEGWTYQLDAHRPDVWTCEEHIRKLPPSERTQWKDTHFQPTDEEVTV